MHLRYYTILHETKQDDKNVSGSGKRGVATKYKNNEIIADLIILTKVCSTLHIYSIAHGEEVLHHTLFTPKSENNAERTDRRQGFSTYVSFWYMLVFSATVCCLLYEESNNVQEHCTPLPDRGVSYDSHLEGRKPQNTETEKGLTCTKSLS